MLWDEYALHCLSLQDVFGGRLTAFVHNAGLNVAWGTTSAPEAPANLEPDEDWNDRIYGAYVLCFSDR